MFCVVGLGNPGSEYTGTRHNLGFRVADCLAARSDTRIRRSEFRALTATIMVGRTEVLLMKPQTYMNLSGEAVAAVLERHALPPARLVVVHDDADLGLGRVRVRAGGGAGGHRGIQSIIETAGLCDFVRVKLGVGRPPAGEDLADFLLADFDASEEVTASALIAAGADATLTVLQRGVAEAMQAFNGMTVLEAPSEGQ